MMGAPALEKWIATMVDALLEGLDAATRTKRAADLKKELQAVEQREEALLREAEDAGYSIDPRADADPRIALMVQP